MFVVDYLDAGAARYTTFVSLVSLGIFSWEIFSELAADEELDAVALSFLVSSQILLDFFVVLLQIQERAVVVLCKAKHEDVALFVVLLPLPLDVLAVTTWRVDDLQVEKLIVCLRLFSVIVVALPVRHVVVVQFVVPDPVLDQ